VVWTEPLELPAEPADVNPEPVAELVSSMFELVLALLAPTASAVAIPAAPRVAATITPATARRAVESAGLLFIWNLPVTG